MARLRGWDPNGLPIGAKEVESFQCARQSKLKGRAERHLYRGMRNEIGSGFDNYYVRESLRWR